MNNYYNELFIFYIFIQKNMDILIDVIIDIILLVIVLNIPRKLIYY